jgi:PAS domain S-box-containing protein
MAPLPSLPGLDDSALYRTLFAAYPDALLLVDLQGTIRLANPTALELLGYSADELIGLPSMNWCPRPSGRAMPAYRNAYAEHPRARPMGTQMDLVASGRDGSEVMVEIALSPLQDQGLPYVVAAIRNVGAYPRVKQALRRAHYAEYLARFGRLAVEARDSQHLLELVPTIAAEALRSRWPRSCCSKPMALNSASLPAWACCRRNRRASASRTSRARHRGMWSRRANPY